MTRTGSDAHLAARLGLAVRARLLAMPVESLPVTYQALCADLGLSGSGRIRALGAALEWLMEQDAAAQRPLLASCVVSRAGRSRPAPGFFDRARALRLAPEDDSAADAWYRRELARALAWLADARRMAAYRAARYRCWIGGLELNLTLDRPNPEVAAVLARAGVFTAACLTAWNPGSRLRADSLNRQAGQALDADLAALGLPVHPGEGLDPTGAWPPEPARLVLGIERGRAVALGRRYGQRALLWIDPDGSARLVDCRLPVTPP